MHPPQRLRTDEPGPQARPAPRVVDRLTQHGTGHELMPVQRRDRFSRPVFDLRNADRRYRRSISGARARFGHRQHSFETFGGTVSCWICSRSRADKYFVPVFTWISFTSTGPTAKTSNSPNDAPEREHT